MAALAGGLPRYSPLQRFRCCWLPGVSTMGSECLALQWGVVGCLLPRKWACAPALEFGFPSSMAVAERRRRVMRPVVVAAIVLA